MRINKANVVLLFLAAMLYVTSVGGAMEVLAVYVIKEPLSWSATQVTFLFFTASVHLQVGCAADDLTLSLLLLLLPPSRWATGTRWAP